MYIFVLVEKGVDCDHILAVATSESILLKELCEHVTCWADHQDVPEEPGLSTVARLFLKWRQRPRRQHNRETRELEQLNALLDQFDLPWHYKIEIHELVNS